MSIEARHRIQINKIQSGIDIHSSVRYANGFEEHHPRLSYSSLDRARKGAIVRTLAWMTMEKINRGIDAGNAVLLSLDVADIVLHQNLDARHILVGIGATAFSYLGGLLKKDSTEEATRNSQVVESIEEIRRTKQSSFDKTKPYVLD